MYKKAAKWATVALGVSGLAGCQSAGGWPWRKAPVYSASSAVPPSNSAYAAGAPGTVTNPNYNTAAPGFQRQQPYGAYPEATAGYPGGSYPAGGGTASTAELSYPNQQAMAPQQGPYDPNYNAAGAGATGGRMSIGAGAAGERYANAPRYSSGSRYDQGSAYGDEAGQSAGADSASNWPAQNTATRPNEQYPETEPYQQPGEIDYEPGSTDYRPGDNGYIPGDTGYRPPGVETYRSPGAAEPSGSHRQTEPHYRPGGTGDYLPSGGSSKPAPGTNRYGQADEAPPAESGLEDDEIAPASYSDAPPDRDRYGRTILR